VSGRLTERWLYSPAMMEVTANLSPARPVIPARCPRRSTRSGVFFRKAVESRAPTVYKFHTRNLNLAGGSLALSPHRPSISPRKPRKTAMP